MKKQLLQETQIRRMMKFANIGALSDGFVGRLNEQDETEEPLPGEGEEEDMELGGGEEDLDMEMGGDPMDMGGEEETDVLDAVAELIGGVQDFVRKASKDPAAADMISMEKEDAEGADDMDMDMDMEAGGEEMEMPDEDESPMGPEEPMEEYGMGEDDTLQEVEVVDDEKVDEEMMNEVARRVARRVRLMQRRSEML